MMKNLRGGKVSTLNCCKQSRNLYVRLSLSPKTMLLLVGAWTSFKRFLNVEKFWVDGFCQSFMVLIRLLYDIEQGVLLKLSENMKKDLAKTTQKFKGGEMLCWKLLIYLVTIPEIKLWRKLEPVLSSSSNDGLVGIDAKLEDIKQILEIESAEVRFVGIWGMGGIGKTTLAKHVFNQFRSHFDISCCLENVRENSKKENKVVDRLLIRLQLKLLSSLRVKVLKIDNLDQEKARIKNLLSQRKVLLLLDDVDNRRQLEHLAGKQDWFGQGSRVIVTTRDMYLLDSHEAPFSKYKIGVLNTDESLDLFCQKAFKGNRPEEGYEEFSQNLVQYCQGLPLALEVLGSLFRGRDRSMWEDVLLKNIEKILQKVFWKH